MTLTQETPLPTRTGGFKKLRVVAKVRESRTITSFHLEPLDPADWRPFEAGQFLVFKLPSETGRPIPRSYSLSSAPSAEGTYRITVKLEIAPAPDLPEGLGSTHLHRAIEVGSIVEASAPRGEFILDRTSSRPVVLLSGGVGLTPLVSMLHVLSEETHRKVHFIHACDNGDVHALRDEVRAIAAAKPHISAHFVYRFPSEDDHAAQHFHSSGVITRELLQNLLPMDDYDVYMCGPAPFMQAVFATLRSLGIPKERIAYEFFGPATLLQEHRDA
ncbi:ferredoxin-NADP reductase [Rhodoligotrophos appendicifer]|uniref:FAD-binding oxidoreductase n=1 Tax=Rhodoligotrophos appendicifer TaxID=987056 RepID=UPI00117F0A55|nr:FAD-binding oxidoreductase [Rhodoligotrophos appendicifer]